MKKLLLTLACFILATGTASAIPIQLDPGAALGAGFGTTGTFNQLQFYAQTTSTDTDATFSDIGDVAVKSLVASTPVDDAGLDNDWFLVGGWNDLVGVNPTTNTFVYTSGTLNLWATTTSYNFGSSIGAGDDSDFRNEDANGVLVATLELREGLGVIVPGPSGAQGTIDLVWDFTFMHDGFWLDENGQALSLMNLPDNFFFAIVDANTDQIIFNQDGTILSDHDGSVSIGVIPEPATMALFGTGLFGLAGAGIKRRKA
ncbi:MAG: PEP-CTERM sorting domain-containing protein [Candidatus Omnitrophota bacterium]